MVISIIASMPYAQNRPEVPFSSGPLLAKPQGAPVRVDGREVRIDVIKFSAKIYKLGVNPVVDPAEEVLAAIVEQAGRSKGPIPVRGTLNGAEFVQTLVRYRGKWRLYVNGEMLKASGLNVGDTAHFEIEFDPSERIVPVPPKFRAALDSDPRVAEAFDKLTPGRKKEILRYLGSLRSDAAVERNIERVLTQLRS